MGKESTNHLLTLTLGNHTSCKSTFLWISASFYSESCNWPCCSSICMISPTSLHVLRLQYCSSPIVNFSQGCLAVAVAGPDNTKKIKTYYFSTFRAIFSGGANLFFCEWSRLQICQRLNFTGTSIKSIPGTFSKKLSFFKIYCVCLFFCTNCLLTFLLSRVDCRYRYHRHPKDPVIQRRQ